MKNVCILHTYTETGSSLDITMKLMELLGALLVGYDVNVNICKIRMKCQG